MNIDELLTIASADDANSNRLITIPKEWSQGRTVYGGLSAAMLYIAAKRFIHEQRPMRSMTTNFVGPLLPQVPL